MNKKNTLLLIVLMIILGFIIGYFVKSNAGMTKQGAAVIDADSSAFSENMASFLDKTEGKFTQTEWTNFLSENGAKPLSEKALKVQKTLDDLVLGETNPNETWYRCVGHINGEWYHFVSPANATQTGLGQTNFVVCYSLATAE